MRSLAHPATRLHPWCIAIAIFLSLVTMPQPPARAGGWWSSIDLDRYELLAGEPLELSSEVFFDSRGQVDAMEQARSGAVTYYAYLLLEWDEAVLNRAVRHDFRPDWWRTPARMLPLGQVAIGRWNSNLARARATLEVPDIEPGRYSIMVCDLGCERPLGHFVPTPVRIFDAEGFAQHLNRQIDGLVRRSGTDRDRIRKLEHRLADARGDDEFDDHNAELLGIRVSELNDRVDELATRPDKAGVSWPWVLVVALVAALLSSLLTRRRVRPRRPPPAEPKEETIERDLAGVS